MRPTGGDAGLNGRATVKSLMPGPPFGFAPVRRDTHFALRQTQGKLAFQEHGFSNSVPARPEQRQREKRRSRFAPQGVETDSPGSLALAVKNLDSPTALKLYGIFLDLTLRRNLGW